MIFNFTMIHTIWWLWCNKFHSIKQLTAPSMQEPGCISDQFSKFLLWLSTIIQNILSYPVIRVKKNMPFCLLCLFKFPKMLCRDVRDAWHLWEKWTQFHGHCEMQFRTAWMNPCAVDYSQLQSSVQASQKKTLLWRHNGHDGVSNHQTLGCLLNR